MEIALRSSAKTKTTLEPQSQAINLHSTTKIRSTSQQQQQQQQQQHNGFIEDGSTPLRRVASAPMCHVQLPPAAHVLRPLVQLLEHNPIVQAPRSAKTTSQPLIFTITITNNNNPARLSALAHIHLCRHHNTLPSHYLSELHLHSHNNNRIRIRIRDPRPPRLEHLPAPAQSTSTLQPGRLSRVVDRHDDGGRQRPRPAGPGRLGRADVRARPLRRAGPHHGRFRRGGLVGRPVRRERRVQCHEQEV